MTVKGAALAYTGKVREGLEILHNVRDEVLENGFVFLMAPLDVYFGAVLALAGQIEKGARHLNDAIKHWTSFGNYSVPITSHGVLGDIYRRVVPGKIKLPFGVILKNLWFIARTLPVASRKARRHYEEAIRCARACNMPVQLAWGLYGLGVLSLEGKEFKKARAYLEEAIQIAESEGLYLAEKIRDTLDSLEKIR